MNLLLLSPAEVAPDGGVFLADDRARHLREVLRVAPGREVRAGLLDGPLGSARVEAVDAEGVRLTLTTRGEPPPRPRIDLLLAVPRPKVLKRLWAPLASLGVGRVLLTNARRVERCYFDSHAVRPETYRPRLIEGLAQARDTRVPAVEVHRSLKILVEDRLDEASPDARRLLADPAYRRSAHEAARRTPPSGRLLLALGPEGGWSAYERDLLERHGFVGVGLGPRILRSDVAVVALLALAHEALER
ncbi:MAG TPA: RsmE family RNA methyltransferase [Sandaracinaceae bacterium LLY-WYZ-13_1]|nr:RsmE family RNA methyltransferase [Sandaracinaceae bacterium LLY-WYZ-13_1]